MAGYVASQSQSYAYGFITDNLDTYSTVGLVELAGLTSLALVGASSGDGVVDIVFDDNTGYQALSYVDVFYYHIWVIPLNTNLGSIVANQFREVELWNAHFTSKTFTGYTVTGDIDVTGTAAATMPPLASEIYNVSIPLAGAPQLEAQIVWTFTDAEESTFAATFIGQRVIIFKLPPNWQDSVVEQITYKTDVMTGLSGKEQRYGLRQTPRRRWEMTYLTVSAMERSYLENIMHGWHMRTYAVPFWVDATHLRSASALGATTFDIDTVTRDFDDGALLYLTDGVNSDTLEITGVTEDSVTTATGALSAYNVGTRAVPARLGSIEDKPALARHTNYYESVRLAWRLNADQVSTNRLEAPYAPELYRGIEVYNVSNDYRDAVSVNESLVEDIIDADVGLFAKYEGEPFPRRTYSFSNLLEREEFPNFLAWVHQRKGKLEPMWFCERVPSFFLRQVILADDTTIRVFTDGYTQYSFPSVARRDIAIRTSAGWKYRRITGSATNDDGTDTITIDTALGVAVSVEENPLMSYLKFVRLDQDMVEISYETSGAARIATAFTDLLTTN